MVKKRLGAVSLMAVILMMAGCGNSNSGEESVTPDIQMTENADQADAEENISTEVVADYPAAIMVNDIIYLLEGTPMSDEVDNSAIIGYTESFTGTFPENNGETNFNPELGMPYAQVKGGIAVLYQNEWYLCTPFANIADEAEIICEKTAVNLGEEENESRIIVRRNVQEMKMSLTVYLIDGTSATIQYPMCTEKDYAYCETAYLQYDNKKSIVLEIVNGTSNYGAAEYHVLHVDEENDGFVIVEDATILDGQYLEETNDRYSNSLIEFDDYTNTSFTNEENLIINRNNKPAVCISVFNSNTREIERYCLYYDQKWKVEAGDISALLIKAVLLGDTQFLYVSDGKTKAVDITDIPNLFDADDLSMKIWDFAVVDLDRDGEDEVILFVVGVAGDMGGKLILHQIDGKVYGYTCDNRTLEELKADGTFGFSDPTGAAEGGIGAITGFSELGYTIDKVSYGSGTHESWDTFIVDHQPATEDEYFAAVAVQSEKPDAVWYDFSDENIRGVF